MKKPSQPDNSPVHSQPALKPPGATRERFTAIFDVYYSPVYNYICYRCGDVQAADDLAAQTFEKVLAHLDEYDPARGPLPPWLFTIARNLVNNYLRSQSLRAWFSLEAIREPSDRMPGPEEIMIRMETHHELMEQLKELPAKDRDLLALKFGGRLNNRQIAEITGLSESNVGVMLFRTCRRLQAQLVKKEVRYV